MKFRRAPGLLSPPVPSDSLVSTEGELLVPKEVITRNQYGTFVCPLCNVVYRKSQKNRCRKTTIDQWTCTRPKGHEGPCVGCRFGRDAWNHNLDRYYWEDIITTLPGYAQLPEQTPQPLEI